MYLSRVTAILSGVKIFENGNEIFFGGSYMQDSNYDLAHCIFPTLRHSYYYTSDSMRSPPAILPRVCVGPSTSPQHQGRVNISWDPLPCHLQNGANVTGYTILYTHLSTGVSTRISSSHRNLHCNQEIGGLYSCVILAEWLIPSNQAYSIQVAAVNNYGDGLFSDPIIVSIPLSSRCYIKLCE
jgi:hypothetical protein